MICDLSESGSIPKHAVLVSVSNNGNVTSQSAQHLYVAYNPICFKCTRDSQTEGKCQKEVNVTKKYFIKVVHEIRFEHAKKSRFFSSIKYFSLIVKKALCL